MNPTPSLFIDTSDNKNIRVAIAVGTNRFEAQATSNIMRTQAVLPLIYSLLQDHNLTLSEIRNIEVNVGPGSFTGLRVGCAVANALSTLLNVPVNGKKALAQPTYF